MSQESPGIDNNTVQNQNQNEQPEGGVSQSQEPEKMVPQSQVNKIVHSAKLKGREQALREFEQMQSQQNTSQSQANAQPAQDLDTIRRIAAEEARKLTEQQERAYQEQLATENGRKIADEFNTKLHANKDKYSDYDTVVGNLVNRLQVQDHKGNVYTGYSAITDVITMASKTEDPAGVLYELAKNPSKLANIRLLYQMNPDLGFEEVKKIENSIKKNQEAQNIKFPNEPLSQIKSSPIKKDSGSTNIRNLRLKYKGQG